MFSQINQHGYVAQNRRDVVAVHRRQFRASLTLLWALSIGSGASPGIAGEGNELCITPREQWSTAFGGSNVRLRFDVTARKQYDGVFNWSLSANDRTIEAGESAVHVDARHSATLEVPLRIPPVNDGVLFEVQLSVSVTARGQSEPIASLRRPILIFPRNPFFERSKWLQELSISLFDPDGKTAEVFESAEIPFKRIRNVAVLDNLEKGLLIVGEGVSFLRNRSLAETLTLVAVRGVPVLCLAPSDGRLVLPIAEVDKPSRPLSMAFRGNDVIREFDKRLDPREWMSNEDVAASRICLRCDRGRIVGEVSDATHGWPWIELRFRNNSTLVYCGFAVIKRWDDGPTPRFLLARLFEHLTNRSKGASVW